VYRFAKSKVKRILVITLTNTGDIILTTPVIGALLNKFGGAKLDIAVGPNGKEIFERDNRVSKIFVYDKHSSFFEKFRLIKKLRNMRYDLACDLRNTIIPVLINAKFKSPMSRRVKGRLHKVKQHLSVVKFMGVPLEGAKIRIEIGNDDFENAERLIKNINKDYIVISCGAKSHTKRWPASYFAALSDIIKKSFGCEVVLVGKDDGYSPDSDRVVADKVKMIMQSSPVDIIGKTNIRELAAVFLKARLVITNDSAPLHVASAVNAPVIAIFGPTDERKYGPLSEKSIILRKHLKCAPCEKAQCRSSYECMRKITVDDALNAVRKLLDVNIFKPINI